MLSLLKRYIKFYVFISVNDSVFRGLIIGLYTLSAMLTLVYPTIECSRRELCKYVADRVLTPVHMAMNLSQRLPFSLPCFNFCQCRQAVYRLV